jgi:hypothetical protein
MKKKMMLSVFAGIIMSTITAQDGVPKKSIAVALPNIENLDVSREIVAKLIQIELIKLDQYKVYDEFDMKEALDSDSKFSESCYGKNCLHELGKVLKTDYVISTGILSFGNRIVMTMKIMDINSAEVIKTHVMEFVDDKKEIQRMLQVMTRQMHGTTIHPELLARISHDEQPIIKSNVNRINNSGPRMGYSFFTGDLNEFARRSTDQGGLDIHPSATLIGYQFEKQYIGTENFSALGEVLVTVSALEKGYAIPSVVLMNGFRFGKAGWEVAFGPGFGFRKTSRGFFDSDGLYGNAGDFWTLSEFQRSDFYNDDNQSPAYETGDYLDNRSNSLALNTRWVMAVGRTFRAGGLNIPVNVFYSSMRNSSMIGMSVGFNVVKN